MYRFCIASFFCSVKALARVDFPLPFLPNTMFILLLRIVPSDLDSSPKNPPLTAMPFTLSNIYLLVDSDYSSLHRIVDQSVCHPVSCTLQRIGV